MSYSIVHDTVWETHKLNAAMAKLLGTVPDADSSWAWMEAPISATGLDVSEHSLPVGMDFDQFAILIWGEA